MDTNLVQTIQILLTNALETRKATGQIWGQVVIAALVAVPAIMAYFKASSAEKNTKDTQEINKVQSVDLKEIHVAVNSQRTALESQITVLNQTVLDLSKKLATATELQRGSDQDKNIKVAVAESKIATESERKL